MVVSLIYKDLKLINKKNGYVIGKWAKDMKRAFTEKETLIIYKYIKRCFTLLIRELQSSSIYPFHLSSQQRSKKNLFIYLSTPWNLFQDPQWMPEAEDGTERYAYHVFPAHTHTFSHTPSHTHLFT